MRDCLVAWITTLAWLCMAPERWNCTLIVQQQAKQSLRPSHSDTASHNGASQCTCHKSAAGPAERPRAFNNKTADFGCLATVAGTGDDLVVFKAPLCYLMLRHPFPCLQWFWLSAEKWVGMRTGTETTMIPQQRVNDLKNPGWTAESFGVKKYRNFLHLSVG